MLQIDWKIKTTQRTHTIVVSLYIYFVIKPKDSGNTMLFYKEDNIIFVRDPHDKTKHRVSVFYIPTRMGKLLKKKPIMKQFIGHYTSWRTFPDFDSCSYDMSHKLL